MDNEQQVSLISGGQAGSENQKHQFYAVRKGKDVRACIFLLWSDCCGQVKGHEGAEYASFGNFHDAVNFVTHAPPPLDDSALRDEIDALYRSLSTEDRQNFRLSDAYINLATVFGVDVEEIKQKWKSAVKERIAELNSGDGSSKGVKISEEKKRKIIEEPEENNRTKRPRDIGLDIVISTEDVEALSDEISDAIMGEKVCVDELDEEASYENQLSEEEATQVKLSKSWLESYRRLRVYYEENGNLNMDPSNPSHATMLSFKARQRKLYKQFIDGGQDQDDFVSRRKIRLLNEIDFNFATKSRKEDSKKMIGKKWMDKYEKLKIHYEEHGHFTMDKEEPSHASMRVFISQQRSMYRKFQEDREDDEQCLKDDSVVSKKIELLKEIDFDFEGSKKDADKISPVWKKNYEQLKEYYEEHGDLNMNSSNPAHAAMRLFMSQQRSIFKKYHGNTEKEHTKKFEYVFGKKIEMLKAIDFDFERAKKDPDRISSSWTENYEALKEMYKTCGGYDHLQWENPDEKKMLNFMSQQRVMYRNFQNDIGNTDKKLDIFSREKIKLLQDIDFNFEKNKKKDPRSTDHTRKGVSHKWMENYERLKACIDPDGNIHDVDEDEDSRKAFQKFLKQQRRMYQDFHRNVGTGKFSASYQEMFQYKVRLLNAINFKFDDGEWEKKFAELEQFVKENGHCKAPETHELYTWVRSQKYDYALMKKGKSCRLDASKFLRLTNLGVELEQKKFVMSWEEKMEMLREFKRENGHMNIKLTHPTLGFIIANIRSGYRLYLDGKHGPKLKALSEEKVKDLMEMGFVFKAGKSPEVDRTKPVKSWEGRFQELVEFKEKFGHAQVPQHFKENRTLGTWVHTQRNGYKHFKNGVKKHGMTTEKVLRLAEIGFVFETSHHKPARSVQNTLSDAESENI